MSTNLFKFVSDALLQLMEVCVLLKNISFRIRIQSYKIRLSIYQKGKYGQKKDYEGMLKWCSCQLK